MTRLTTSPKNKKRKKIIILGAGGREFHNFNVCFRDNPAYNVVAFTATQIPNIENRVYPPELSGKLYSKGIPIFNQRGLPALIKKYGVDEVIFAYSDVSHLEIMHTASLVLSLGCDFRLMGPKETMISSRLPVISVCAARTGCGKSKVTLQMANFLRKQGKKVVILRHPMAYGNLKKQACQRFENLKDMDLAQCTIEEREEYEPLVKAGFVVFAGVDYQKILSLAEKEADIILWDGGNNDFPFLKPDLHIVICDPKRPGHEISYHPGETNLRMADLVIITKVNDAPKENINIVLKNIKLFNPRAKIVLLKNKIIVDKPEFIRGKRVLVIEDGPTVTHGEMSYGAGYLAAKIYKAKKILEPKRWARGQIKHTFEKYPHLKHVLPAMGYGKTQLKELEQTINSIPCQTIVSATPVDIKKLISLKKPLVRVSYQLSSIAKCLKMFKMAF